MSNSLVLGIDQSITSTGYCLLTSNGRVYLYGVFRTKPDKTEGAVFRRCRYIAESIANIVTLYDPAEIYFEGLSYGSAGCATRDLGILLGFISSELKKPLNLIAPSSLKKFATGKGNSPKDELLAKIQLEAPDLHTALIEMPKTKGRLDISDAYWLARYAGHQYDSQLKTAA